MYNFPGNVVLTALLLVLPVACTPAKTENQAVPSLGQITQKPLSEEESQKLLGTVGENWFYGQGVGETALAAGTVFLFPPYAFYLLGNAVLGLSGYEQMRLSDALPEEERKNWLSVYDGVTSAPGQVSAAVAGREFITKEHAKDRVTVLMNEPKNDLQRTTP